MEILLKDWKEENDWKDGDDLEEFFYFYTNHTNSIMYYNIDEDDLDNSYREGSVWIMERLNDDYGVNCDDIVDTLNKISNDNEEYKRQLIYFIGQELQLTIENSN
jgi:hypothetical protein